MQRRSLVFAIAAVAVGGGLLVAWGGRSGALPPEAPNAALAAFDATPPSSGPVVRFVAIGDGGRGCRPGDDGQCRVAAAIEDKCKKSGCDFAVMLGDNIYPAGVTSVDDPLLRTNFEEPYAKLEFPFYVALGNHDYGTNGAGLDYDRGTFQVAYTLKSAKWRMPGRFYRERTGALELFALDTQQILLGNETTQRRDVKAWIAESKAPWKIAFGHHPIVSNGPHGNAGSYDGLGFLPGAVPAAGKKVKNFFDEVVCGKVDVYLAGHDHNLQWIEDTCAGTELIVSGGAATVTKLEGRNRTRYQASKIGFLYVTVDETTFTGEFIDSRGNVEFTRAISKRR